MNFSSKLIENAVEAFASLPGIGRKTALRLTLHLVGKDVKDTEQVVESILKMRRNIQHCSICHNLSDETICEVCSDKRRERSLVCVVESIRDVMAIESTSQYRGMYHVLGGLINPLEGVGPGQLQIDSLLHRVGEDEIKEIILSLIHISEPTRPY